MFCSKNCISYKRLESWPSWQALVDLDSGQADRLVKITLHLDYISSSLSLSEIRARFGYDLESCSCSTGLGETGED